MDKDATEEQSGWPGFDAGVPASGADPAPDPVGPPVEPEVGAPSSEGTVDRVDSLLDEVERALARLDDGTYGRCAGCGASIDDGRLAIEPTVETCGACASGSEHDDPAGGVAVPVAGGAGEQGPALTA